MNPRTAAAHRPARPPRASRRGMRGAMAVVGVLWLGVAVICLMVIDIGHVFWQQREVQKIADMAAMARAGGADQCEAATPSQVERLNGVLDGDRLIAECGNWNPTVSLGVGSPPEHFALASEANPFNAARVTIERDVPYFFVFAWNAGERTVRASATAAARNIASFSVGTGVARLNGGLVNNMLGSLLGVSLNVVSYEGLVKAPIRVLDLVSELEVGSVEDLLNTEVKLKDFLLAMVGAARKNDAVAADLLAGIAGLSIKNVNVLVGDMIKVMTPNKEAAATASVNVFDLLMTAAEVANGTNVVKLGTDLNLGSLATAETRLVIVEPPSIAIGEAGQDENGVWRTQAKSASVRMMLKAKILSLNVPGLSFLLRVTALELPIYLEVAPGHGRLTDILCEPERADCRVKIQAKGGLANVCIAQVSDALMLDKSNSVQCSSLPAAKISEVSALGIPVLHVNARIPVRADVPETNYEELIFNGVIGDQDDVKTTHANKVGTVLHGTVGSFTNSANWVLTPVILGSLPIPVGQILSPLLNFILGLLSPLFALLDAVVAPLLNLLGAQVGYADIHHQSLSCGEPFLVY